MDEEAGSCLKFSYSFSFSSSLCLLFLPCNCGNLQLQSLITFIKTTTTCSIQQPPCYPPRYPPRHSSLSVIHNKPDCECNVGKLCKSLWSTLMTINRCKLKWWQCARYSPAPPPSPPLTSCSTMESLWNVPHSGVPHPAPAAAVCAPRAAHPVRLQVARWTSPSESRFSNK